MSLDAFLATLRARPDDDLPRLALADWLEEAGDGERAEFVRLQCELARPGVPDARRALLEDREHELLDEHESAWRGFPVGNVAEWQFRRGFVDQVRLPLDGFADWALVGALNAGVATRYAVDPVSFLAAPELTAAGEPTPFDRSRVAELDLSALRVPWDQLGPYLSQLRVPNLRVLSMPAGPQADPWGDFARLGLAPQLIALDVSGIPDALETSEPCVAALRHSRLERLGVSGTGLSSAGLARLLAAPALSTVADLDISENPIAPDAWRAFRLAHAGLRLRRLDVSGTPLASISLEQTLASRAASTLTDLEINRCGSARRNLEVVAASPFWAQATHFRAHSGTIPARTLEPLCQSAGPPALELLDLADNYLRTEGVEMLCDSRWAKSLRWLALSRNYLDDDAARLIARAGAFPKLRTLHLAYNRVATEQDNLAITDAGARALADSPTLSRLRILTLSGCPLTAAGVGALIGGPHWSLSGLGLGSCELTADAARVLARSPALRRLEWLDLSGNPGLRGEGLRELAASPHLSPLCELDVGGLWLDEAVRAELVARLGPRLSE